MQLLTRCPSMLPFFYASFPGCPLMLPPPAVLKRCPSMLPFHAAFPCRPLLPPPAAILKTLPRNAAFPCCLSRLPFDATSPCHLFQAALQHCLSRLPLNTAIHVSGSLGALSWQPPLGGGPVPPPAPSGTRSSISSLTQLPPASLTLLNRLRPLTS